MVRPILIRNNLTQDLTLEADDSAEDHNILFNDPEALFVDASNFDLHLLAGAAAIDAGSDDEAPSVDFDRIPRPQGSGIDVGAFEWHDGSAEPVGPSPPVRGMGGNDGDPADPADPNDPNDPNDPSTDESEDATAKDAGGCSCRSVGTRSGPTNPFAVLLLVALGLAVMGRGRGARR